VANAQAQLEHQANRIMNLELLLKFGANSWRAQVGGVRSGWVGLWGVWVGVGVSGAWGQR
jgi:hypothetical protein